MFTRTFFLTILVLVSVKTASAQVHSVSEIRDLSETFSLHFNNYVVEYYLLTKDLVDYKENYKKSPAYQACFKESGANRILSCRSFYVEAKQKAEAMEGMRAELVDLAEESITVLKESAENIRDPKYIPALEKVLKIYRNISHKAFLAAFEQSFAKAPNKPLFQGNKGIDANLSRQMEMECFAWMSFDPYGDAAKCVDRLFSVQGKKDVNSPFYRIYVQDLINDMKSQLPVANALLKSVSE
jgi:hypothetical protein